jgi:hypothetical protein
MFSFAATSRENGSRESCRIQVSHFGSLNLSAWLAWRLTTVRGSEPDVARIRWWRRVRIAARLSRPLCLRGLWLLVQRFVIFGRWHQMASP